MARNVISIGPVGADAHAQAETERKRQLFAWANRVLEEELGLADRIARATDLNELRKIVFDPAAADLAIREALHPASGKKADCFDGLNKGALRHILKNRFSEMKKDREDQLRHSGGRQTASDWTDRLKFDDEGGVLPTLSNLILFLRHHQDWERVLGYDEFAAIPVTRKRPPFEGEGFGTPDAPWTDHHDTLTRAWFQDQDIKAAMGDVGRAVQAAAKFNRFHPVRDGYLDLLEAWDGKPRIDTWLINYCHAADSAYVRAVGPRFLNLDGRANL